MSLDDLDPHLTAPKRLAALGILSAAKKVEFGYLREQLQLSDSDLSKQLKVLTDAGYATSNRTGKGKTRTSWFEITSRGSQALSAHAVALLALLNHTKQEIPDAGDEKLVTPSVAHDVASRPA